MFPLGLGYIAAVLKKNGYKVDGLNLNHYEGTAKEIITRALNKKKYDFVGTGTSTLEFSITKKVIEAVRHHSSKPKILLGGLIITSEPELIFDDLKPDIGFIGEAEETIIDFLKAIEKNKDLKKVKGLIFKNSQGKTTITSPRDPPKNLDKIPFPDFDVFDFEESLNHLVTNLSYTYNAFDYPRAYTLLGSRSCPYHCTFCYHNNKYRERSVKNMLKELKQNVKKYKINVIILYDECFALNNKRLNEFCKGIVDLQKEVGWEIRWTAQVMVNLVNDEILKTLKNSGCDTVSYGFESYSPIVLKSMRKPITPEKIDYAFKKTLEHGMAVQGNFIFGDIAETKQTAKETLDYWKKNSLGQIQLIFIQPYPGSAIYHHCVKKGIIKNKKDFITKELSAPGLRVLNMTDSMTDEEIKQLHRALMDLTSKYCKFVRPRKIKKIKPQHYEIEIKCPYCKKIINYKNCYIKNPWSYSFKLVCRNRDCNLRYYVANGLEAWAYKNQSKIRKLRDIQKKILNTFRKKRL